LDILSDDLKSSKVTKLEHLCSWYCNEQNRHVISNSSFGRFWIL